MTATTKERSRLADLFRLMDALASLHAELERAIVAKIEAMRRADVVCLQYAAKREQAVVERVREREGLRKQLMDAVGVELGLPAGQGRKLTISKLASKLTESSRVALWRHADTLRRSVASAAQANRVAAVATRDLLHHLQWVFAAIRPAGAPPMTYSRRGTMVPSGGTMLLETVG